MPYKKVIIETEKMCKIITTEQENEKDLEKASALEQETQVKKLLSQHKGKRVKANLTSEEFNGKKEAYQYESKIYLPADKGKVIVAMDKTIDMGAEDSYEYKMLKVLEDMKAKPPIRSGED